jgi:carbon storage regulator CsrA
MIFMLTLGRRVNEDIVFPELGITIRVQRINGNNVRIGIDAPREYRVLRGELVDANNPKPERESSAQ